METTYNGTIDNLGICTKCGQLNNTTSSTRCVRVISIPTIATDSSHGLTEDKRPWPAIRAEEKLRDFNDKVTIVDGKSEFHYGWRKCLEWIEEEYNIQPKSSPPSPSREEKEMPDIIKFLCGECEFNGVWFGDSKPAWEKGNFWWRKHLREAITKERNKAIQECIERLENVTINSTANLGVGLIKALDELSKLKQ